MRNQTARRLVLLGSAILARSVASLTFLRVIIELTGGRDDRDANPPPFLFLDREERSTGILRPDRPYRPELWPLNRTLVDFCGDEGVHGGATGTDGIESSRWREKSWPREQAVRERCTADLM
jgi:hypothetical protein